MILFVTGTDTGVGKTFACGCIAAALAGRGLKVGAQKWVSTGDGARSADMAFVYALLGRKVDGAGSDVAPYCLAYPASPHLASEMEGVRIERPRLIEATRALASGCDLLLCEGVGGVLVPLRRDLLLADLVAGLSLPALVVARSGLGTINHTLLTLQALSARGVPVVAVLLNSEGGEDPLIVADNMRTLEELGRVPVLGPLPRFPRPADALPMVGPLALRLWQLLEERTWT